jgi:hypothetical protein
MQIERRRLDSLQLDPDNAREHDRANIDAIKASLEKFGQRKPIVVADGVVIAGNGTMEAAQALGWEEIDTVSADDLDETERRAYAIADNRTAELAKWNQAKLAEALSSVTEDGDAMGEATGFDHQAIVDLLSQELGEFAGEGSEDLENPYTHKIEPPVYEPRGECPSFDQLIERTRYRSLVQQIRSADLDDEVEDFLLMAATRHLRFDYEQVAEFYCHATPEVQRLMEESALVIIDFDRAVELGYVTAAQKLRDLASEALDRKQGAADESA